MPGLFDFEGAVDKGAQYKENNIERLRSEVEPLVEELIQDISYLKSLDAKDYLLHKKYIELERIFQDGEIYNDMSPSHVEAIMDKTMNFEDVQYAMENDNNKIEIILCNGQKYLMKEWLVMRYFISSAYWQSGTGRNLKYILSINDKYAGIVSLASDVISIGNRDTYIGWDKDVKHKNLGCIGIGSTIVPTQPLGYFCTGGKLLALMFYSQQFRNDWEDRYGEKLVGCTTTSLYGQNSQYNGMNKYWKSLGTTTGDFVIFPSIRVYEKLRNWNLNLIKYDAEAQEKYARAFKFPTNSKMKNLNFFFGETGFKKKYLAATGSKDLSVGYQRGIYFSRLYENTFEYLRDGRPHDEKIELIKREGLDFEPDKPDEIFAYWKRKWAKRRFERLVLEGFERRMKEKHYHRMFEGDEMISKETFMRTYG